MSRSSGAIRIYSEGVKTGVTSLPFTVRTLHPFVANRPAEDHVFMNRLHLPIRRNGIYDVVKRHGHRAALKVPSIATKQISPHIIRHSVACHLLRGGVDLNTIRAWLGHVEISMTNIYAQIDLEMKAKALARCEVTTEAQLVNQSQGQLINVRQLEYFRLCELRSRDSDLCSHSS